MMSISMRYLQRKVTWIYFSWGMVFFRHHAGKGLMSGNTMSNDYGYMKTVHKKLLNFRLIY